MREPVIKTLRAIVAALALAGPGLGAAAPARAQNVVRIELGGANPTTRALSLPRGKSAIIDLPVDARDVLVSDPKVADAVLRTARRIYVLGVTPGQTDAVFFDAAGRKILSLDIRVDQPTSAIEDTLRRVAPNADVKIEAINDSLILTGAVDSAAEGDRIQKIAERFVAKPEMIVNGLTIRGAEQVMIKVRVVEMQRNLIKQLGFNTSAVLGQVGITQFTMANAAQFAVNNGLIGGLSGGYALDTTQQAEMQVPCAAGVTGTCYQVAHTGTFPTQGQNGQPAVGLNGNTATLQKTAGSTGLNQAGATIQAFEQVGLVRSLAEPNLTAVSGENAKFLAGGEFPVPTGVDQNGNVIVTFKAFGVGLAFTPVVLSEGRISMKISTEVSELSTDGELKFNNSLTIPSLTVRRAETTVEMPSGGAIMMAGMLKESTQENIAGIPGMTNLPVLGALFRSRDYLSGETELVVIVEAYLVKSTTADKLQTPVDGLQIADDMDTDLLGRINKAYKAPASATASAAAPPAAASATPAWQGPVGYVIE
jgi:pilus assembly protein CpaC